MNAKCGKHAGCLGRESFLFLSSTLKSPTDACKTLFGSLWLFIPLHRSHQEKHCKVLSWDHVESSPFSTCSAICNPGIYLFKIKTKATSFRLYWGQSTWRILVFKFFLCYLEDTHWVAHGQNQKKVLWTLCGGRFLCSKAPSKDSKKYLPVCNMIWKTVVL